MEKKFILLYSHSGHEPYVLGIFKSNEEAHIAMEEDYSEELDNAISDYGSDYVIENNISINRAYLHTNDVDIPEEFWSIVNIDEIESF